jgi:hypothetical protein
MVNLWRDLEHGPLLREFWAQGHLDGHAVSSGTKLDSILDTIFDLCHTAHSIKGFLRHIFINFMGYSADVSWDKCEQSI